MKQEILEGYYKKIKKMIGCFFYTQQLFHCNIKPTIEDDPKLSLYWQSGASTGILMHFLRSLKREEQPISVLVFEELACMGVKDGNIDVIAYIDASLSVLEELGCPLPEMEDDDADHKN